MKPAPFLYHNPDTVAEALSLLNCLENARALAGGQSLVSMMNFRFVQPDHLVDLKKIDELKRITFDSSRIAFGAMTTQAEIEHSKDVARLCPVLQEALLHTGHRQTRNRGTIGGSLCHLDPTAELVACAALHDGATFVAASERHGERHMDFAAFAKGYLETGLRPDELLVRVEFPLWPANHGFAFEEVARRHGDFAIVAVGALVELAPSRHVIQRCALVAAGLNSIPIRLTAIEKYLQGRQPDDSLFADAAGLIEIGDCLADAYVSDAYRRRLVKVLSRRAVAIAVERAQRRSVQ
ncbi:carbon-monoxide dehydrogenase medium subunit [Bradyrhizobium sp. USDA 4449]